MTAQVIEAYPLSWPIGWPRTPVRQKGQFGFTFARARDELFKEIDRLGGRDVILSTNINLRRDGLPYANTREPSDPGVAVYFKFKDLNRVFACDKYSHTKDNIRAITKTIEALRGIERWGASDMLERAFTGFEALPAPPPKKPYTDVLEIQAGDTRDVVLRNYRKLRSSAHRSGDSEWLTSLQEAWKEYEADHGSN